MQGFAYQASKRFLDVAASSVLLVLLSPLLAATALLVRWKLGSPVLFRQRRPGLRGRPFALFKFRTMTDARDARGNLRPDAERLPPFGVFLRSTSLDELPELINVLRGEMSLVGPRPLIMAYLDRYTPEQRRRHDVQPGITGWAQVNGRNAVTWEERFACDLWYVAHVSFWLDVKILMMTVRKVIAREGISAAAHPTMPEYKAVLGARCPVLGSNPSVPPSAEHRAPSTDEPGTPSPVEEV